MKNVRASERALEPHECVAERKGDWVVFTCPHCDDYVRRINLRTGAMISPQSWNDIKHNGVFMPIGLQPEIYSPN